MAVCECWEGALGHSRPCMHSVCGRVHSLRYERGKFDSAFYASRITSGHPLQDGNCITISGCYGAAFSCRRPRSSIIWCSQHFSIYLSLITLINLISAEYLNLITCVSAATGGRKTQQVINFGWGSRGGCRSFASHIPVINCSLLFIVVLSLLESAVIAS